MPPNRNYAQGVYWLLTIPQHLFVPYLHPEVAYIKGQLELGHSTGYLHWQVLVVFKAKARLGRLKTLFGQEIHAELCVSKKARDYVWKEDTRVAGTQFELGQLPFRRNSKIDWDDVWKHAQTGNIMEIPSNVRVQSYRTIKQIEKDFLKPTAVERSVKVYVGPTGTGKSRRAWEEAGIDAYPKDPNTKFWDGYQGQQNVVMDEFRGKIDISNILRWTDRYPVSVETKGSGTVFKATNFWITSNIPPSEWYPGLDEGTQAALLRRLVVEEMNVPYYPDIEN